MAHAFANRVLFALVVCVVVSLPFVFHAVIGGGSDESTDAGAARLVATSIVDPYVKAANDEAFAEGRDTTLADVEAGLPAPGDASASPASSDGPAGLASVTPVFTVAPDRITATVTALGAPVTCTITISAGRAVDRC